LYYFAIQHYFLSLVDVLLLGAEVALLTTKNTRETKFLITLAFTNRHSIMAVLKKYCAVFVFGAGKRFFKHM
jgi:hypothetical protein